MHLRYIGPSADGVVIAATGQEVKPGETVEVVWDVLGKSLCEQKNSWEPVPEKAAASKKAAAPAADKE